MTRILHLLIIAGFFLSSCNTRPSAEDALDFEQQLQEKINAAKEGDVIELPEGKYEMPRTLQIKSAKNITIHGKGRDLTILSFKRQNNGDEGVNIAVDGAGLEDMTLLDAKEEGIKVQNARNVNLRRLKIGRSASNDKADALYGVHAVRCAYIMIQDCDIFNATKAGVYVEQSQNTVIRKNHLYNNNAGCKITNCADADINENRVEKNAVGILVLSAPEVSKKNSVRCRIFNNTIVDNNKLSQDVDDSTSVESISGAAVLMVAASLCEIYTNELTGQNTFSVAFVGLSALQKSVPDSVGDPFCSGISVHDNKVVRGNGTPDNLGGFGQMLDRTFKGKIPDIVYDGGVNPHHRNPDGSVKEDYRVCIHNNANASFGNMDLPANGASKSTDSRKYDCSLTPLHGVKLN